MMTWKGSERKRHEILSRRLPGGIGKTRKSLVQECKHFTKIQDPPQNSMRQAGDRKQVQ